jgi:hypothetical protein
MRLRIAAKHAYQDQPIADLGRASGEKRAESMMPKRHAEIANKTADPERFES